jgi:transcriptional regulator with XRE-family HTH domain
MNETLKRIVGLLSKDGIESRQYRRKLESITGVSYSAVSQWFNGDTKEIEYKNLKSIADYYQVDVDYLLGDSKSPDSTKDARLSSLVAQCKLLGIGDIAADQLETLLKAAQANK